MNDVKSYIESGILELYVLEDVSPDERLQVEQMAAEHPAIMAELRDIELALAKYAEQNAVEPSEAQRSKVLNSLLTNFADDSTFRSKNNEDDNVVVMTPTPLRKTNVYKYAFAASIALLIGSLVALNNIYNKLQQSNGQLLALQSQNTRFSKTVSHLDEQLEVFRDPSYKVLKLKGTQKVPTAELTIAWNPVKGKVMMDMADMKLPVNDNAHQYQLWALVNGKPVDLGVFDKAAADTIDMKQMKSVALAGAFAVTLEPRGGSINPTMNEMVVLGQF